MNLSYLKYAVEVEKTGSITKAAQNYYMNQPHLSKIIRELERDLGCPIFDRTSRGMIPTVRGEEFLRYAKGIMEQEAQLDKLCSRNKECPREIRLCGPRASYISIRDVDYGCVAVYPGGLFHLKIDVKTKTGPIESHSMGPVLFNYGISQPMRRQPVST